MATNLFDKPLANVESIKFEGDWDSGEDANGNTTYTSSSDGASITIIHAHSAVMQKHPDPNANPPYTLKVGSEVKKKDGSYEVTEIV